MNANEIIKSIETAQIKEVTQFNVGDTIKDKEAAEGAGLEFVHAKYGFGKNIEATYYIESIKDLPELMSRIDS